MFGAKEKKFRAGTFDMAIDDAKYMKIHQKVLDDESGWSIIEEKSFTDEVGKFYIFMKWTEPK